MSAKPRVVIDTQIFLRAAINDRSLPAKIIYDLNQLYVLLVADELHAEVKNVFNRPAIRTKFKQLTDQVIARALKMFEAAEWITIDDVPVISRDPKDDMFLAVAVVGKANYIVSEDKDLLSLNPYEGIQIVDALAFLHILEPPSETND